MKFLTKPLIFSTNNSFYCYDDTTKNVIPINDSEKKFLESVPVNEDIDLDNVSPEKKEEMSFLIDRVKKLFLFQMVSSTMKTTESTLLDMIARKGIFHLVLILTEACDFRCRYCIYSDYYQYSQSYSSKRMNFDTAKKAIDYYFSINNKSRDFNPEPTFNIGFYGGEPTLQWKLIVKIVEYVKAQYPEIFKKMRFLITTNGFTLNDKKIEYMAKNHFSISLSLDGNKDNHDRNRVTANLKPTYEVVFENIKRIHQIYESKKFKNFTYGLLITVDNLSDFYSINEFFEMNKDIDKHIQGVSPVKNVGTNYYEEIKSAESLKKRQYFLNKLIDNFKNPKFENKSTNFSIFVLRNLISLPLFSLNYSHTDMRGACIPGLHKLAVDAEGNYHMCEKVNLSMPIGHVDFGINVNNQLNLINNFKGMLKKQCETCSVKNACQICFVSVTSDKEPFTITNERCKDFKKNFLKSLSIYYEILEENPYLMEHLRK